MKDFNAFFKANKAEILSYAKANTNYNAEGKATISKNDDWFYDDVWEKELRGEVKAGHREKIAVN